VRRRPGLALLVAAVLVAGPARASVEEFSGFDVAMMEEDDENMLDHFLSRPPDAWRDEWERSNAGFRSSEGCLTSGLWYLANDFRSRAPLGSRAWMDVQFRQVNDDEAAWQWLQLDFRYPTSRFGTPGWRFRPSYDKSQQDFAALWDYGDGATPLQVQAVFTFEDLFNSLWEFRQARVGNHSEPYRAHPFEPALRVVSRGAHHRVELSGTWLTPSRKLIRDPLVALDGSYSLWGSKAFVLAEAGASGWLGIARFEGIQALSSRPYDAQPGDGREYRRRWTAELALRRELTPALRVEARYVYQARAQDWRPPIADATFRALDRMPVVELDWTVKDDLALRVGAMYDRIGIGTRGAVPSFTYGSRKESRAFIGLQARFGRVRVQGVEGIELDAEPYEVTFHHDKGFLQMQTAF